MRGHHLGPQPHLDVLGALDPADEVLRHGRLQPGAPHEHDHPLGVPGEVQYRLAGRVRRTDDVDVLSCALQCLGGDAP